MGEYCSLFSVFINGLEYETLNIARHLSPVFFHLFLHNLGVLSSNLSDDILSLVSFTFKLGKQKMAAKNQIFSIFLLHINSQFSVFA